MSSLGDEQTSRLRAAKLRALVAGAVGDLVDHADHPFPNGAALTAPGDAWILVDDAGPRSLGPALTWAVHHQVSSLSLVLGADASVAGDVARRAELFSLPISVWRTETTTMVRQPAAAWTPLPEQQWDSASSLIELMESMGLEVVYEDGVVKGEYLGLEVARVIPGTTDPAMEVGIGRFDREIAAMMHAGEPTATSLRRAIDLVARHRIRGGPPHPLRDLMLSRWLRTDVIAAPDLVGATSLAAIETTVPVSNLKDPAPAAALGIRPDGAAVVVVCSSGSDLDVVPIAADTRAVRSPGADLVVAVPRRNIVPTLEKLAATLSDSAEIVAIDPPY